MIQANVHGKRPCIAGYFRASVNNFLTTSFVPNYLEPRSPPANCFTSKNGSVVSLFHPELHVCTPSDLTQPTVTMLSRFESSQI
jgi:hypothetical protein